MSEPSLRRFATLLVRSAPRAMVASVCLIVLLALTEGAGILLLVPLLSLAGVTAGNPLAGGAWMRVAERLPHSLGPLLVLYVGIVGARAAVEFAESIATLRVQVEVTRHLRDRMYRALVRARWEAVAPLRGARLAHVLTSDLERVSLTTNQLLAGVLELFVAITYAVAAVMVSPSLALVAAAAALALLLPARRQQRAARRDGDALRQLGTELFAGATEEVATLKVAKSAGLAERVATRFSERASAYAQALIIAHGRYRSAGAVLTAGAAAALAVVVYVGVMRLHLPPASLLLLLFLCARLVPRITGVQSSFLLTARALPAAAEVQSLLDELESAAEGVGGRAATPMTLRRSLELRSVTYSYPGAATPTLRDVSLEVPAGRVTALVGPSGAGKSTLADIVLLLLTPQHGTLCVDGAPLSDDDRDRWRAAIGYVPQETHLFHDSVRENVRWIAPDASDAEVLDALRLAGASELLARLPTGLDTVIGDRGTLLSGGERQRLALARALLVRPRLLVLDEATSALDPESELAIRQTIAALTPAVTVLTITHRLTTARQADHVVVLEDGAVVAAGEWSALMAAGESRLSRLWAAQLGLDDSVVAEGATRSS
ncbi:MAG TPA: ABC transporter ATP-binding protein/permease [Gemmatimonadaceae bacterium]|jgi:ATP-binding cassette subfamily C protein|nr:ABC transporter ATP-binding protein/permease [Gemmatimonadaceae bacterium]